MADTIQKFMGDHLTLPQVEGALRTRGLDISALENFSKEDFRHLLDGIEFAASQMQGIMASGTASTDQAKDNIASAYEGARAAFQKSYTSKNKKWVIGISLMVVLLLNASLIRIYEVLAANQNLSQAISGTASTIVNAAPPQQAKSLTEVYDANRKTIKEDLQKYPVLLRTREYPKDLREEAFNDIAGLLLMVILVSLGAPFWNDVLKSMMGVNNALNTNGKKAT